MSVGRKKPANGDALHTPVPVVRAESPRIPSLTEKWLERLYYLSHSMTAEIRPAECAELLALLQLLRLQRDSIQFPKEP